MSLFTSAHVALRVALEDAATAGEWIACRGPHGHYWTSDSAEERAVAAALCDGCPVLAECHTAAESTNEVFLVWAGVDREAADAARRARNRKR